MGQAGIIELLVKTIKNKKMLDRRLEPVDSEYIDYIPKYTILTGDVSLDGLQVFLPN